MKSELEKCEEQITEQGIAWANGVLKARRELKEIEDDPSALEKLSLTVTQLIKIRDKGLDLGLKWNLLMLAEKKGC